MKTRMTVLLAGAMLLALSGTASANGRVSVGIAFGVPGYAYAAPAPAYYYPPPVYYAPPPIYYAPVPWGVRPYGYWGTGWRGHNVHRGRGHW
jgi:hypothetical protein